MDIEGLQATLRRFAADRGWEPFHSPKNLAMALMVEAAELAEIYQWMTPEQSRAAHGDAGIKQHIGEELADVLLYLLQVADQTGVDLNDAVLDKLAKNARKHPSSRKAALDRLAFDDATGAVTHVLLDYENVQPGEDELRALVPEATRVWVFHGPHQKHVAERFASYGDGLTEVPISRSGKNALDFHLSFYMGYIASRHPDARMVVVANDQGYSPMLDHAKAMGFAVQQIGHAPQRKAPARKRAPSKKALATAPAKSAAPKKVAAKKAAAKAPRRAANAKGARPEAPPLAPAQPPAAPVKKAATTRKATARKPAGEPAPADKVPAPTPSPAAKKAAGRKASAKGRAATAPTPAPPPTATPAVPVAPVAKLVDALRKMGQRRPAKAAALRRTLKPLLGATASDEAVGSAFDALVAHGAVAIGPKGEATYPLFT